MIRISQKWTEFTIDLDEGGEEWIYTAHFFPKTQVPADVVDPWKKKMMDKAKNKQKTTLHPVVPPLGLCVPESQDQEEDPIDSASC